MEMDLDGKPYGYTPFCNDRKEMEKYRFWNGGYWEQHLKGKPYHIRYGHVPAIPGVIYCNRSSDLSA